MAHSRIIKRTPHIIMYFKKVKLPSLHATPKQIYHNLIILSILIIFSGTTLSLNISSNLDNRVNTNHISGNSSSTNNTNSNSSSSNSLQFVVNIQTTISPTKLYTSNALGPPTERELSDQLVHDVDMSFNQTIPTSVLGLLDVGNTNLSVCTDSDSAEVENCSRNSTEICVGEPDYCNYTYDEYVKLLHDYIYPTTPEWILIISHSVVFIMGLVGNALVCIAVYTNHSMRTVTNIFIVNLAVADFFVILFCLPPTVVWDVTETWFMGEALCKVITYFQTVSVTVSVLTLTFISIDRWYAICFPLRYVSTNERAIASIALIWAIAILSDIPEFLVLTIENRELRFNMKLFMQCVTTWDIDTEKKFNIIRLVLLYTLPLLLMTIAYFQIVKVLWKSDTIPGHRESRNQQHLCGYVRNSCGPTGNSSTMGQLRARRKAAKMLVAVVVMFAACYFPVHLLNILRYSTKVEQTEVISVLSLFSHWLCYANSAINPLIYNFMSGKFRREFKNALEKCRCIGTTRGRVEDRSMYHSAPGTRINNISPNSRSNYQLTSVRDIARGQALQSSFTENNGHQHLHSGGPHHHLYSHYNTNNNHSTKIQTTNIDGP